MVRKLVWPVDVGEKRSIHEGEDFHLLVRQLLLGFLFAFASGLFACKAMIRLVKKASLGWFAIYCAIVGILCIVL